MVVLLNAQHLHRPIPRTTVTQGFTLALKWLVTVTNVNNRPFHLIQSTDELLCSPLPLPHAIGTNLREVCR